MGLHDEKIRSPKVSEHLAFLTMGAFWSIFLLLIVSLLYLKIFVFNNNEFTNSLRNAFLSIKC